MSWKIHTFVFTSVALFCGYSCFCNSIIPSVFLLPFSLSCDWSHHCCFLVDASFLSHCSRTRSIPHRPSCDSTNTTARAGVRAGSRVTNSPWWVSLRLPSLSLSLWTPVCLVLTRQRSCAFPFASRRPFVVSNVQPHRRHLVERTFAEHVRVSTVCFSLTAGYAFR